MKPSICPWVASRAARKHLGGLPEVVDVEPLPHPAHFRGAERPPIPPQVLNPDGVSIVRAGRGGHLQGGACTLHRPVTSGPCQHACSSRAISTRTEAHEKFCGVGTCVPGNIGKRCRKGSRAVVRRPPLQRLAGPTLQLMNAAWAWTAAVNTRRSENLSTMMR